MSAKVSIEEAERIARLMRIEVDDHEVHMDEAQKMIVYMEILDEAAGAEEYSPRVVPHSELREDKAVPFEGALGCLRIRDGYVRSPRLS
ncbi:hypothetical protein CENSYa_0240 [Cenarchaeum symbiosum A]|uniref:Asp-tRNA(Asn)/Glu-tRNA(Gln) amidotransferase GatCAB subunit C n=1 Tax=Cenarchaeum symbiosum (strain A) TaxID=414004 RepID=A0RU65_CENSY|nr:hypothetical protein CENSYa_0240 [Cenarchaeum symbiosum A]